MGSKNFKYLDELIQSGEKEVVLDSDIVLGEDEESEYNDGIKLDVDNLAIDGNGHAIDARGLTRIFYCIGKNVTIKNIILKNGFTKEDGGAIYNEGELTITESTLTENTAKENGGAIQNWKGELTITESTLNNNTARGYGGAIHNNEGELTITESTLTGNTAEGYGGAIHNNGGLTITESTLTGNTAQMDGGAIHNNGELTITESTLTGNTARWHGGAINNRGELTITESTLNNNTAQEDGGAINNNGELTITESTLTGNTAQKDGGAIHNYKGNFKIFNCEFLNNLSPDNIILNNDSLQIYNAIFRDNQSSVVVLNDGDWANLGIFYGEFRENNVGQSVLCNSGKFCGVEKTVFQDNISNDTLNIINNSELTLTNPNIKDEGKSILNQNYILIKKSSPELEKKIYGEGTVEIDEELIPQGENFDFGYLDKKIHESNNLEVILDHDITFENYESDFYEGGIELDIDDLIIDGNGHTIDGADKSRIFIITGKNITLKNITFKNGHSHKNYDNPLNQHGGAIKINHNSKITIKNCEFINNTSEVSGGAIDNNGGLTITESTLTGNTARYGGAIHNNGELTITESTLNNNTAQAKYGGGAIFNNKGVLTITESTLTGNTANWGGAIHNWGELTITESTLNNNTAQRNGGAISNNEGGELTITESTLNNNNTARWHGGAISNNKGVLTITESTLTGNTAEGYGGAIFNNKGVLTITESTLTGNTAQKWSGGAINNWGELTITESTLTGNTVQEGSGGAISNTRGGELTITESTLTGNTARSGGAINNRGELTITESTLNNNTAQRDGGAIYSNKEINISNCTLVNNLQSSFSFVEKNNRFDIAWNDDFISSYDVTIYLDNKCDGEYHIVDNLIEWNKILSKGPHEIIFELKDNNKIIMNFTYSPDIITTNVNNYDELINSINKANYILTPQYIINLNKGDYNATKTIVWKSFSNSNLIINGNGITLNGQNKCQFIKIGTNSKLTLNNIILTNFTAQRNGGAIFNNKGVLTITESTLTENTTKNGDGGAIHNSGELTITESTLNNNTAQEGSGGAIYNWKGELTITESTLNENTAKEDGGAIHNSGELTITESTLNNNTANNGGTIYLTKDSKKYESENCTFKDNKPDDVYEDK